MPAAAPTNDPSVAPVTLRREATNAATVMIPAAATSATTVAAFGFTDSSTRENMNSTSDDHRQRPDGDQDRQQQALSLAAIAHRPISARISRSTFRNLRASQPSVVSSWPQRKKIAAMTTHRISAADELHDEAGDQLVGERVMPQIRGNVA